VETRPQHALENRALLAEIARSLVTAPVHVRVEEEKVSNGKTVLSLYVLPADRGRIIGRRGHTIRAIRQLFSVIGTAEGHQLIVELDEGD
jgi:predicted RNA-binding protein YlqC (UPF0109 family)